MRRWIVSLLTVALVKTAWGQPKPTLSATQRLKLYKPKPYEPPVLDPEPVWDKSPGQAVVAADEALVLARPWAPSPLVGGLAPGEPVAALGVVAGRDGRGCSAKRWIALGPGAYVCAGEVRILAEAAAPTPYLPEREGKPLPWDYVMVKVPEGESIPLYVNREQLETSVAPERDLMRGDTVAVEKTVRLNDETWWLGVDGRMLAAEGAFRLREQSAWAGVATRREEFPFGWIARDATTVYDAPSGGRVVERLSRRTRVAISGEVGQRKSRRVQIGEGRWVLASAVNEVRLEARTAAAHAAQWIDVDLGEQVLVLYQGADPIYATLVSSGRAIPTPLGDYPVWAKVATVTMKNPPYEDKPYFVHRVPWVLFFQAHNALHGAYWHDRFGATKSHGCINLAPRDARFVFEWVAPSLPNGWTGVRPVNLLESVLVHVRNSASKRPYRQDRPIGPQDAEEEKLKLEAAEERRLQLLHQVPTQTP